MVLTYFICFSEDSAYTDQIYIYRSFKSFSPTNENDMRWKIVKFSLIIWSVNFATMEWFQLILFVQSQEWKNQDNVWILFKVNKKTPEKCQCRRSSDFVVDFEQISHIFLVFPLLNLSRWMVAGLSEIYGHKAYNLINWFVVQIIWLVFKWRTSRSL